MSDDLPTRRTGGWSSMRRLASVVVCPVGLKVTDQSVSALQSDPANRLDIVCHDASLGLHVGQPPACGCLRLPATPPAPVGLTGPPAGQLRARDVT
jgi:hypothetical protein